MLLVSLDGAAFNSIYNYTPVIVLDLLAMLHDNVCYLLIYFRFQAQYDRYQARTVQREPWARGLLTLLVS